VSAGNNGAIDLRAGGTAGDIAINGATLRSTNGAGAGSGTVQLVAGRDISTSTANSGAVVTPEIRSSGSVLLQAAGTIGADGQRIEIRRPPPSPAAPAVTPGCASSAAPTPTSPSAASRRSTRRPASAAR
jgi:hypothetical protein